MTSWQKIISGICMAAIFGSLLTVAIFWRSLVNFSETPGPHTESTEIQIETGANPLKIARLLEVKGLISDANAFYRYQRYLSRSNLPLQAGDYEFDPGQTPHEILEILRKGRTKEIRFTVPEGSNKVGIAQIIEAAGFGSQKEIIAIMTDPNLALEFGVPKIGAGGQTSGISGGIEGYLFPDTYQFPKKTPIKTILTRMRTRLDQVLAPEMRQRMEASHLSMHEMLTIAAMVEKETGDPFERPEIASVFFNRLALNMKLQTDPTVIYAINNFSGNITKAHLQIDHPYNTYFYTGLPPGPIASPGLLAIRSVLWPNPGKNLYFVSRNNGTHEFCPTLTCHEKAVKIWQIDYFRQRKI